MTLRSVRSRNKRKQIGVFDYSEEDERVEEQAKKLLRKFDSPVTKTSCAIDKYAFLQCFAQNTQSQSKEPDHIVIDVEVPAKEEPSRSALREDRTVDLIDVISNDSHGRSGIDSSTSSSRSENDEGSTKEATDLDSDPNEVDPENEQVLIIPDVIIYGDIYCTNSKLTFSCNCMSLESSSVNATKRNFNCEWTIEDIIMIESQWCLEVETAVVNVILKSKKPEGADNAEENSGIDLLKFSVYNPKWSKEVENIKLLASRYKDIWDDTTDRESAESSSSGHNLGTSLTNLVDSFEDLVYPKGVPDAVVVRKQDIELLKPRRFINDTIIDFYIMYLKNRIPPKELGRFHFFNCFFFRKLANLDKGSPSTFGGREAYQRVQKWTKDVDLFEKDYIFVPINFSFHWSLIIICHPGELVPFHVGNPQRVPCILHLDSIKGSHKGGLINIFPSYLCEEWKARHGNTTMDFSRPPNMQSISLELPQQENSFDCGLFLLHYLELFVAQAPVKFNPSLITRSSNFLTRNWFPAKEASVKRKYILELLYKLHKGHDPSILPANSKSEPPHCEVSNKEVTESCNWRKPCDGSSSTVTDIPQAKTCAPDLILSKENFYRGGYDPQSSKLQKVFMSPIVEEVETSGEETTHLAIDIEESTGHEIEPLHKEKCLLYIEDSEDEETIPLDEYVSDSQDSIEIEMKEEDDDDELVITEDFAEIHGTRKIKYDSTLIRKGVNKKSRDSTGPSCHNNLLHVLSDDERSSDDVENLLITCPKVMAKKPKT